MGENTKLVAGFRLVDAANKHLVKMSDINHRQRDYLDTNY
jgi:hypothetical protein